MDPSSDLRTFEDTSKRQRFSLNVRPRIHHWSFRAVNGMEPEAIYDWGDKTSLSVGIEGEYFLPMNRNKWAVILEAAYLGFSESTTAVLSGNQGSSIATVDYLAIEVPLGIRHYFFISDKSRIFLNVSIGFDVVLPSSQFELTRTSGYPIASLDLKGETNIVCGAGFRHRSLGFEIRYQTIRDPFNRYVYWESEFDDLCAVFSYSIQRKRR